MKQNASILSVVEQSLPFLALAVCLGGLIIVVIGLASGSDDNMIDMIDTIGAGCMFLGVLVIMASKLVYTRCYGEDYNKRRLYLLIVALGVAIGLLYPLLILVAGLLGYSVQRSGSLV